MLLFLWISYLMTSVFVKDQLSLFSATQWHFKEVCYNKTITNKILKQNGAKNSLNKCKQGECPTCTHNKHNPSLRNTQVRSVKLKTVT